MVESLDLASVPKNQIYHRRLMEGSLQTSCIVLACARQDARMIQEKLMTNASGGLGKGVEFIPYKMLSIWSTDDYLQIFSKQNIYISDVGAVPIMGVSEERMKRMDGEHTNAFQDFLLANEHILSIEKSNTLQRRKWWILGKKEQTGKIVQFLNKQGQTWMEEKESEWREYFPPNTRLKIAAEDSERLDRYSNSLRKRLNMTHTYKSGETENQENQPTYAQKVESINESGLTPAGKDANKGTHMQQHTIITAQTTESSTLTNTEEQQRKMQEQIGKQGQQMENMLICINQMMDKMQQMFSTMSTLLYS